MHVTIDYPDSEAETRILHLARNEAALDQDDGETPSAVSQERIFAARQQILELHMIPSVEEYIVQLIMATRQPQKYGNELSSCLDYGVSPRGTIALDRCARAYAWLNNRDYVTPEDVQHVAADVLRHRIGLSFEAEAKGITADRVVREILELVPAP